MSVQRQLRQMKHTARMLDQQKKFGEAQRLRRQIKDLENGKQREFNATKKH